MEPRKLSIRDIAKEANVSATTVSRVLNNNSAVKEETRQRVQKIMDKNHYKPNELARGLFKKRTKSIGVVLPEITNHFFAKVFMEIERSALEYEQSVFLCNTLSDHSLESFYIERLLEKQVDGLLLLGGQANESKTDPKFVKLLKNELYSTPLVVINGKIDKFDGNYSGVSSDEYEAMFQAVEYLTSLEHEKIAFLGGREGIMSTDIKIIALKKASEKYKFEMKRKWVITSGYTYSDGVYCMNKLLSEAERPTAIMTVNDQVAAGVINTCIEKGIKIPDDFSVFGFDDSYISINTLPTITTLAHPYNELGEIAVKFLNDMINKVPGASDNHISLKMRLIERNSCKANMR